MTLPLPALHSEVHLKTPCNLPHVLCRPRGTQQLMLPRAVLSIVLYLLALVTSGDRAYLVILEVMTPDPQDCQHSEKLQQLDALQAGDGW